MGNESQIKVVKTINYFRVTFHEACQHSLEHYLALAHDALPLVHQRTFPLGNQEIKGCHAEQLPSGCYAHVTVVTPGEAATTVPDEQDTPHVDLQQIPPPEKSNYMDGDMCFFLKGNHLLFCSTHLPVSRAKDYIREVFEQTGQPDAARAFTFTQVADVDKLQMIQTGVKSLSLGAGLFPATARYQERQTVRKQLLGGMMREIFSLFQKDPSLKDYTEEENITAELVIKFNRSLKGGAKGQLRMQKLAEMVIDDKEHEGFKIKTYNNESLTAEDVVLRKSVRVEKDGKTVQYRDVWENMRQYFAELQKNGLLEQ